jgi:hypothetical protein
MARIEQINPKDTTGKAKDLLDNVQVKFGKTPNIFKAIANSPAALEGFLRLQGALAGGVLSEAFQKQVSPFAFLRLMAVIIVLRHIPQSEKELGFRKKKPLPAWRKSLSIRKLR